MIIENLVLENVGPHERIIADFKDANIVGIVGPNGSGKSNILKILAFLFTGKLPKDEDQESFVRNFGREGAAKIAKARCTFRIHGTQGSIMRQLGKTSKRELIWGDEAPITIAKEVEKRLDEILGADRAALGEAIFIPQGEMAKLFDGNEAEREKLFNRLLLLGHLESVERALDGKVKMLFAGIEDLSGRRDAVNRQRADAEAAYSTLDLRLSTSKDWSADLDSLREYRRIEGQLPTITATLQESNQQIREVESRLTEMLGQPFDEQHPGCGSVDELERWAAHLRDQLDMESTHLAALISGRTQWLRLQELEARLLDLRTEYEKLDKECAADREAAHADLTNAKLQVSALEAWQQAADEQQAAIHAMMAADVKLKEFDANNKQPDVEGIKQYEKEVERLLTLHAEFSLEMKVAMAVRNLTLEHCPICKGPVDVTRFSNDGIRRLETRIKEITEDGVEARRKISDRQRYANDYVAQRGAVVGEISIANARFLKASGEALHRPSGNLEELRTKIATTESVKTRYQTNTTTLNERAAKISEAELALTSINKAEIAACNAETISEELIVNLQTELGKGKNLLGRVDSRLSNSRPVFSRLAQLNTLRDNTTSQRNGITTLLIGCESTLSSEIKQAIIEKSWDEVILELSEKVRVLSELRGQVQQAKTYADLAKVEQERLQEQEKKGQTKRQVVEELRRVKEMVSRSGLPAAYVRHMFSRLVEATQENLTQLDANFTVDMDPAINLAFTFTRTDESEPYVMPQSKLSGGQKVRLAVAFLRAIQQIILPGIAFLVLDEPSDGLDSDGKDSLKEMLISLTESLQNSESQIWVCDHSPVLEPAYEAVIRLPQKS